MEDGFESTIDSVQNVADSGQGDGSFHNADSFVGDPGEVQIGGEQEEVGCDEASASTKANFQEIDGLVPMTKRTVKFWWKLMRNRME